MAETKTHNETGQKDAKKRLDAMPWIAGAVLVLGIAVLAGLYWTRTMTVSEVRFEGYHFVDRQELEQSVDIPTGVRPDSLDFMSIIRKVEKIPYVKFADISVEPGGELLISITERQPIALLAEGERKIYVDEDGLRLPLILGKAVDVPIVYGFSARPIGDTLKSDAFRAVRNFLVEVKRKPVSDATISEVAWTPEQGVVALTNENGVKLVFGKEDFKKRLRNWEAFYGEVIKTKGIVGMRTIDLRFRGQVVTQES